MFEFRRHDENSERGVFVRRTRTICIYREARPGIPSKSIAHVTLTQEGTGDVFTGVFCVDAEGSRTGQIIAHKAHVPFPDGVNVSLEIRQATASECVEWLLQNEDPERKAFGHILQSAIASEVEAKRLYDLSVENGAKVQENLRVATEMHDTAKVANKEAKRDKAAGWFIGASGFIFGALLDLGLIEEKTGVSLSIASMLALCAFATLLLLGAPKLGSMIFSKEK